MSPRTQTLPLDEKAMWRKLLARTHPDAGGSHELFIWAGAVRDAACGGELRVESNPQPGDNPSREPTPPDDKPRIPYPPGTDFSEATCRALRVESPYATVLASLADCCRQPHLAHEEARGASYKRLAAIAHAHGMSPKERSGWYRCAEAIPLSDRHASHILGRLKRRAA
jgi:hypothetical protein